MKYAWELWLFLVPIVALITFYVWLDGLRSLLSSIKAAT